MIREMSYEEYVGSLGDLPEQGGDCPVRKALDLLTGKWSTYVLFELCKRPQRWFAELKRALPPVFFEIAKWGEAYLM